MKKILTILVTILGLLTTDKAVAQACGKFDYWVIRVGTNPNDGTGDPLRTAGIKINSNMMILSNLVLCIQGQIANGRNVWTSNPWSIWRIDPGANALIGIGNDGDPMMTLDLPNIALGGSTNNVPLILQTAGQADGNMIAGQWSEVWNSSFNVGALLNDQGGLIYDGVHGVMTNCVGNVTASLDSYWTFDAFSFLGGAINYGTNVNSSMISGNGNAATNVSDLYLNGLNNIAQDVAEGVQTGQRNTQTNGSMNIMAGQGNVSGGSSRMIISGSDNYTGGATAGSSTVDGVQIGQNNQSLAGFGTFQGGSGNIQSNLSEGIQIGQNNSAWQSAGLIQTGNQNYGSNASFSVQAGQNSDLTGTQGGSQGDLTAGDANFTDWTSQSVVIGNGNITTNSCVGDVISGQDNSTGFTSYSYISGMNNITEGGLRVTVVGNGWHTTNCTDCIFQGDASGSNPFHEGVNNKSGLIFSASGTVVPNTGGSGYKILNVSSGSPNAGSITLP
jgi:hypothetical protein